jgi:phosphopantetheinyl transferase (holo-ACP synthase)
MIVGLGVDVFEVSRMEQALREGDPGFEHDLFTVLPHFLVALRRPRGRLRPPGVLPWP